MAARLASSTAIGKISVPLALSKVAPKSSTASLRNVSLCSTFRGVSLAETPRRVAVTSRKLFSVRSDYAQKEIGPVETLDYRIFISNTDGQNISPWHDIPLRAGNGLFNFVCEIPRETKAKMEIATDEPNSPIKQDTKKGKLRFYPYNINWNYGFLPQTWEDPNHSNPEVEGAFGDNDPVDVVEIADRTAKMGEVYAVKPVAILAMIDEGELDWKVIAIRADDPKADSINDIDDVEREFPGTLTAVREWFRDYKIPDGKPANKFGLDNKPAGKEYTLKVIEETHKFWANLVTRSVPARDLSLV